MGVIVCAIRIQHAVLRTPERMRSEEEARFEVDERVVNTRSVCSSFGRLLEWTRVDLNGNAATQKVSMQRVAKKFG